MVAETKTKQSPIPSYVIARIVCHRWPDNGPTVYHAVPCLLPFQDTHPSPAQRASTTLVGHTEGGEGQKRVYRGRRDIKFENNPRRDLIRSRVICNRIRRHDTIHHRFRSLGSKIVSLLLLLPFVSLVRPLSIVASILPPSRSISPSCRRSVPATNKNKSN